MTKGINNFNGDEKSIKRVGKTGDANKAKGSEKAKKKADTQKSSADKGINAGSVAKARLAMQGPKGKSQAADALQTFLNELERPLEGPNAFTDAEVRDSLDSAQKQVKSGDREPDFTEEQLVEMFKLEKVPTGRISLNDPFAAKALMAKISSAKHDGRLASDLDITTPQGRQRQADLLKNILDPRNYSGRNAA